MIFLSARPAIVAGRYASHLPCIKPLSLQRMSPFLEGSYEEIERLARRYGVETACVVLLRRRDHSERFLPRDSRWDGSEDLRARRHTVPAAPQMVSRAAQRAML